ncbi:MAG: sensor histidine kinase [Bryobacteraceae bacterium]
MAGFDKAARGWLLTLTPATAANMLASGSTAKDFFLAVAHAGRHLAMLNLSPERVLVGLAQYGDIDDRLRFAIILALNQAYSDVREQEWRALHDVLRAGYASISLDDLLHKLLDAMTQIAGSSAAHLYFCNQTARVWEVRASTTSALTPETGRSLPASPISVRALALPTSSKRRILDRGWPERWHNFWSLPMSREGLLIGVIQFAFDRSRTLLPREIELLNVAAERCLAAVERARLLEDLAEREVHIREMARRMLQVEEIERRKISRELHDGAGQQLVVVRLQIEMIEHSLPLEEPELRERLCEVQEITEKTIIDIRRLISDLSPAVLEQLGLAAAIRQLVNKFNGSFGGQLHLQIGDIPVLNSEFQIVVYRLVQECLNNASKHSQADNVNIYLNCTAGSLTLLVEDDGIGFHVNEALERRRCFGLVGMRERVDLLGGTFEMISTPKKGHYHLHSKKFATKIALMLPIPKNSL